MTMQDSFPQHHEASYHQSLSPTMQRYDQPSSHHSICDNEHDNHVDETEDTRTQPLASSSCSVSQTESEDIPSNETLLGTAFITFMGFALLQLAFALVAGSEAMMGDSAAMIVDAMTYLFNLYAERQKTRVEDTEYSVVRQASDSVNIDRLKRKRVLQLEILPPLLSVSTLLVITVLILRSALHTLIADLYRDESEQLSPNVNLMLLFSIVNLVLDGLNVFCFAKAKHLRGYATVDQIPDGDDDEEEESQLRSSASALCSSSSVEHDGANNHEEERNGRVPRKPFPDDHANHAETETSAVSLVTDEGDEADALVNNVEECDGSGHKLLLHAAHRHDDAPGHDEHANLNMCSAYTHIFADTLRSIAVIIAAAVAKLVPGVTSEEADATAAVFVSILIVLSLVPLLQGLRKSCSELLLIMAIERQDITHVGR